MGKKATILLTRILFEIGTIILAGFTIAGWFAAIIPPSQSWALSLISLGMFPFLGLNFIILIIWILNKSFWALVPFSILILNIGFITSMVNVDLRSEKNIPQAEFKIASYNIHGYAHKTFSKTIVSIANYMESEGVDMFCMQEFMDDINAKADSLLSYYPHRVICSQVEGMQLAVFSKYPIVETKLIPFPESLNSAMWADIDVNGTIVRVFNIHLQTTNMNQSNSEITKVKNLGIENPDGKKAFDVVIDRLKKNTYKRAMQVSIIRKEMDSSKDKPIIVCGDFNDTPASYIYHTINKGLHDGFKTSGNGFGYTFKSFSRIFRLDYIFYSDGIDGVKYYSLDASWSDHNPVMFEAAFSK